MDKKLQDLVWSILPKWFKEEVKKVARIYSSRTSALFGAERHLANKFLDEFIGLFGRHNLTSDAEGEEMLTVSRKVVQEEYRESINEAHPYNINSYNRGFYVGRATMLKELFNSKSLPDEAQPKQKDCDNPLADKEGCRWRNDGKCAFDSACYFEPLNPQEPKSFIYKVGQKVILHFYGGEVSTITEAFNDGGVWNKYKVKALPHHIWNENELDPYEEPKPAEPKFKMGDYVRYKGGVHKVVATAKDNRCYLNKILGCIDESDLEPYTEPKENIAETRNFSQDCDKQVDTILKDSFAKERRLNIAAMIMAAMMQNAKWGDKYSHIATISCAAADALIIEVEKKQITPKNKQI